MEISSKLHAVEAVEVHYQLHSVALKSLLKHRPASSPLDEGGVAGTQSQEVESAIAEALVELKELPLCRGSYPGLWAWTKQLCSKAFDKPDAEPAKQQMTGESPRTTNTQQGEPLSIGEAPEQRIGEPPKNPLQACETERDLLDIAGEHGRMARREEDMEIDVVGGHTPPPPLPRSTGRGDVSCDSRQQGGAALMSPPAVASQASSYLSLLQLCIYGVAVCAVRYPAFFKPLYRLATTLHAIGLSSVSTRPLGLASHMPSPFSPPPPPLPASQAAAPGTTPTSTLSMSGKATASLCSKVEKYIHSESPPPLSPSPPLPSSPSPLPPPPSSYHHRSYRTCGRSLVKRLTVQAVSPATLADTFSCCCPCWLS